MVQHGLDIPHSNDAVPNFPNYDLGPLQGSSCDTLFLSESSVIHPPLSLRVYPNPVSDWLNIIYQTNENGLFELYDLLGQKVAEVSLYPYFKSRLLDVSELPSGVYLGKVTTQNKMVWSVKVVKQ